MAETTIKCGNKEIKLKATGLTGKLYRNRFRRDMISDMMNVVKKMDKSTLSTVVKMNEKSEDNNDITAEEIQQAASLLDGADLQIFENAAYIMAWQADKENIPNDPDEWLDTLDMFSIWDIMPTILELWGLNNMTMVQSKKNKEKVLGK